MENLGLFSKAGGWFFSLLSARRPPLDESLEGLAAESSFQST